jgi:UDPglucose 6-dehydrogenase
MLTLVDDPYDAAAGAEAVVVLTEWPEFRSLDWTRLAGTVAGRTVVDTRNLLDPAVVRRAGFAWSGIGRQARESPNARLGSR